MSIIQRCVDINPGNPEFDGAFSVVFECPTGTPTAELAALLDDPDYTCEQREVLPTHDTVQFLYF